MRRWRRHRAVWTARYAGEAIPETSAPPVPIAVIVALSNIGRHDKAAECPISGRHAGGSRFVAIRTNLRTMVDSPEPNWSHPPPMAPVTVNPDSADTEIRMRATRDGPRCRRGAVRAGPPRAARCRPAGRRDRLGAAGRYQGLALDHAGVDGSRRRWAVHQQSEPVASRVAGVRPAVGRGWRPTAPDDRVVARAARPGDHCGCRGRRASPLTQAAMTIGWRDRPGRSRGSRAPLPQKGSAAQG